MKQHTINQHGRTRTVRSLAGVAALVVLAVACSGSSEGAADVTIPVTDPVAETPVTQPPVTQAPVITEPPAEVAVDPSEIPDVPCAEYVAESGYPLKPCDSGVLVETVQRNLESLFPAIAIDGLFGGQTFDFVKEFQTSNALEATGLVSEELAGQIASAEALGELVDDADAVTDDEATEDGAVEDEAPEEEAVEVSEEICNDLIGNADDPNFNAQTIEACSDLGIDLLGEG